MKIFISKLLFAALIFFILFELTIGSRIDNLNNQVQKFNNKVERDELKEKILTEIEKANKKENIFDQREKIIISNFLKKISDELKVSFDNKN
tara:strand:+ start:203 stop:478 length:276 start_codon:yes stop_codon:yes gene_type:complete